VSDKNFGGKESCNEKDTKCKDYEPKYQWCTNYKCNWMYVLSTLLLPLSGGPTWHLCSLLNVLSVLLLNFFRAGWDVRWSYCSYWHLRCTNYIL